MSLCNTKYKTKDNNSAITLTVEPLWPRHAVYYCSKEELPEVLIRSVPVVCLSLLLLAACSLAPIERENSECDLRVSVSPSSDAAALLAEFVLSEPVKAFQFESVNTPQRRNSWETSDSGWQFDGVSVSRIDGRSFKRFVLRLTSDTRFFNRRYVAVDQIGNDSWTLLLSAFVPPAAGDVVVEFSGFDKLAVVRNGDKTVLASKVRLSVQSDEHLIYVGSPDHVHAGIANVIAGPEVPAWIHSHLSDTLSTIVERSTRRLGVGPQAQPSVYLTSRPDPRGRNSKGGALDNAVMTIRLRDFDLSKPDEDVIDAIESITNTMAHEAVHLWVGNRYKNAYNEEQPWLHEGSTEYLADRMRMKSADVVSEAQHRLNACLLGLGDRALDGSRGYVQGKSAYDCGYAINFASEIASLQAGNGDIATIWSAILDRSEQAGFTTEDFLAVVNTAGEDRASTFIGRFLYGAGGSRWLGFSEDFDDIGIVVSVREPDERDGVGLRSIFVNAVLRSLCGGGYGYWTYDTHIELDTGDRCGERLKGNPEVASIGGYHIIGQPFESYRYAKSVCDEGGELMLGSYNDTNPINVRCDAAIESVPPLFEFTEVPILPEL